MVTLLEGIVAVLSIGATLLLIFLLGGRELSLATGTTRGRRAARALSVALLPLLIGVPLLLGLRFYTIITPDRGGGGGPAAARASPTPRSASPSAEPGRTPPVTGEGVELLAETYDALPTGAALGSDWSVVPPGTQVTVVPLPTAVDRSMRVATSPTAESVDACRSFEPVRDALVTVSADVLMDGPPAREAAIVSLRSGESGIAAVIVDARRAFAFFDGDAVHRVDRTHRTGSWYRVTLIADLVLGTYDISVSRVPGSAPAVQLSGLALRGSARSADQICFTAPEGPGDPSLLVNDVTVAVR